MNEESCFHAAFPSTAWTDVAAAGTDAQEGRKALEALINRYHRPLKGFLMRTMGFDVHEAADLIQAFILQKILEGDLVSAADREKGRFRAFLATALRNFARDEHARACAAKRGGGRIQTLEESLSTAFTKSDPWKAFDLEWARQVIEGAIARMQAACADRPDYWALIEGRLLRPILTDEEPVPYAHYVSEYGYRTPKQAMDALTAAKRRFQAAFQEEIRTYCPIEGISDEMTALQLILSEG
ncbi:MAG: hypothetical protein CMJ18_27420 [Phycisphaeraceae bacterium]|nr:hypothetical protein [Phycisphaeraceae bacterium]